MRICRVGRGVKGRVVLRSGEDGVMVCIINWWRRGSFIAVYVSVL